MNSGKLIRILMAVLCVISISGCKEKNQSSSNAKFTEYKEAGIQAIKEDRLTDGIEFVLKAISIQDEPELQNILDNAYLERSEYFYSVGEKEKSLSDLKNISRKININTSLFYKLVSETTDLEMVYPHNEQRVTETNFNFKWSIAPECDYYQIQIEDSEWNTVALETSESVYFSYTLEDMSTYYWHIRAHYPNGTWGNWTEKTWFEKKTTEDLKKIKIDRLKSLQLYICEPYVSFPDMFGAVDVSFRIFCKGEIKINKIHVSVTPHDVFDNTVKCERTGYSGISFPIIFPSTKYDNYELSHGFERSYNGVWYNSSISKAKIISVEIFYEDSTSEMIEPPYLKYVMENNQ